MESSDPVFQITLSTSHQLALTVDERVYSWGDNTHGQLGHGDRRVRTVPTLVDALQGKGVSRLAAGQKFQEKIRIFAENPEVFLKASTSPCSVPVVALPWPPDIANLWVAAKAETEKTG